MKTPLYLNYINVKISTIFFVMISYKRCAVLPAPALYPRLASTNIRTKVCLRH